MIMPDNVWFLSDLKFATFVYTWNCRFQFCKMVPMEASNFMPDGSTMLFGGIFGGSSILSCLSFA